ncbi:sulfite exporter TauE/SafE family protein [Actinomadura scrupuli]|uniref:urease accessory protein UreH domain-containing protein n=1 Tax=Actinomadura scrupuli TaxID=559629 RepID=UPI003D95A621
MTDASTLFLAGAGTGLLAGGTSCAAVQLGLLAGSVRGASRPAAPVGVFLAAKLTTHAALGAALGLAGSVVQPGPRVRAVLLAGAAVLLALFALDLLGFRPARRLLRRRDHHCGGRPDDPHRDHGGESGGDQCGGHRPLPAGGHRTPLLLGASTVLVPCGLTLSAELMAVTSRSAPAGAAVMTGFVLGTMPLFGLIGITLGRGLALLRGRLTALVGVGLLLLAGWTLLSGLRLGGWLPAPAATAATDARFVRTDATGTQTITIWAFDRGYRPALLSARAGVRTVLVVRTARTTGCTRVFEVPAHRVERVLPVDGAATIDLGTPRPGRLRFTCAVGHYPGAITFR